MRVHPPFVRTAESSAAPRSLHLSAIVAPSGASKLHVSLVPSRHSTYPNAISSAENPTTGAGDERLGAIRRGGGSLVGVFTLPYATKYPTNTAPAKRANGGHDLNMAIRSRKGRIPRSRSHSASHAEMASANASTTTHDVY